MSALPTYDAAMAKAVELGRFCAHCLCEFAKAHGRKAACATCVNERKRLGIKGGPAEAVYIEKNKAEWARRGRAAKQQRQQRASE